MTAKTTNHYPQSVDALYQAVTDEAFLAAKYAAVGDRNFKMLERSETADGCTLRYERQARADVPSFAKKVVPEWNTLTETQQWRKQPDSAMCSISSEVKEAPVKISGSINVTASGDGCQEVVNMDFDVKIPLIGKKLKAKAESDAEEVMHKEHAYLKQHLASA